MRIFLSCGRTDAHDLAIRLTQGFADVGHTVSSSDSLSEPGSISTWVSDAIRNADLVVALLTEAVPNIYYEIGLAVGANVSTLIAATDPDHVTSDLSSVRFIQLSGDLGTDVDELLRFVEDFSRKHAPRSSALEPAEVDLIEVAHNVALLEGISPSRFERLVAGLFEDRGFDVRANPQLHKQGFDFIVQGDPMTVVEVKRYSRDSLVSVGAVRQLLGAMTAAGAERGILVSSSEFTRSARAAAAEWPIELMTLEDLVGLPQAKEASDFR